MKILLDESISVRLAKEFHGLKISTVYKEGWAGKRNGELLKLAEENFDIFITVDQNMQYQLNLLRAKIPIVVLVANTNRADDLKPLVIKLLKNLKVLEKGINTIR